MDGRPEVAHPGGQHGVEVGQVRGAAGVNRQTAPLGSPHLIAHIFVELTPQAIRV